MEDEALTRLLPIGTFSKMTRLSIKALRLYDQLDLLSPAEVDPSSGYRYYRPGQANRAEAIRLLRGIDMPLDEIREVVDAPADVTTKLLDRHRDRLMERLGAQQKMIAFLNDLMDGKEQLMPYEITVKNVPAQTVAGLTKRVTHATVGAEIAGAFPTLMHSVMGGGAQPTGAPFIIFHDVIDEETDGDIEVCLPVSGGDAISGDVVVRDIAGGPVASTVHTGRYSEVGPAYHALLSWIADHGHATVDGPREIYLNDPNEVGEDEQLTEIQWPIDTGGGRD